MKYATSCAIINRVHYQTSPLDMDTRPNSRTMFLLVCRSLTPTKWLCELIYVGCMRAGTDPTQRHLNLLVFFSIWLSVFLVQLLPNLSNTYLSTTNSYTLIQRVFLIVPRILARRRH